MKLNLQHPSNWSDFQDLCYQLWRELWGDYESHQNGRIGQRQNGVDIFGKYRFEKKYTGVQCKGKNNNYESHITTTEIDAECGKASNFKPPIGTFIIATTSPRDAKIQEHCRLLTDKATYPFSVDIWSWDDIEDEVQCRPILMEHFYPTVKEANLLSEIKLSRHITSSNKLYAFFCRPGLFNTLNRLAVNIIQNVAYELAINAFEHGDATSFNINVDGNNIIFTDDGREFNPISLLDSDGRGGKQTIQYAAEIFDFVYRHEDKNILKLTYDHDYDVDSDYYIELKAHEVFGRSEAQKMAFSEFVKIPKNKKIVIDISGQINPAISSVYAIFDMLLELKSNQQVINIYLPGNLYYKDSLIERYKNNADLRFFVKD